MGLRRLASGPWRFLAPAFLVAVAVIGYCIWAPSVPRQPDAITAPITDPRLTVATPFHNVRPEVGYVGDAVCASCHVEIAKWYRQHPMGRCLAPPSEVPPSPDEERAAAKPFDAEGFRYSVERHGDRVVHRQTCLGPDGRNIAEDSEPVAYVVGSGERARSYFIERDGYLFQSPISWYTQEGKLALSPGYSGNRVGFSRVIVQDCLFCHATGARHVAGTVNRYEVPIFRDSGIGCERCHGPGELHVARPDRPPVGEFDDTIVNPSRLEHGLRESICAQCHLQGAVRVVRRDRDVFDFRPGLPLDLFLSVFIRPPELGEHQLVGHIEEMHESKCYSKGQGDKKMDCISCHDPHRMPAADKKMAFFRGRCLQCHTSENCSQPIDVRKQKSPGDSCIECHMPRRTAADIGHVATTDHRIVRRADKDRPMAAPRKLGRGEVPLIRFHVGSGTVDGTELERDLGVAIVEIARLTTPLQQQLSETALPMLDAAVERWPTDVRAWESRGQALRYLNRREEALASMERAIAIAPASENGLSGAADDADVLGRRQVSLSYWDRAIEINPWSTNYRFRRGQLWSENGEWDRLLAECDAVLKTDENAVEMRLLRVAYLLHKGDLDQARSEFKTAMAMHPRQPEAVQRWFDEKLRLRKSSR
jgi:hypothetical protein